MARKQSVNGKNGCPVTRAQFAQAAKPLLVSINGTALAAPVHDFSTGSFGWYVNGRVVVEVDSIPTTVQVGLNLTVIGSKEAQ
jgi:hypothetical protein